MRKPVEVPRTVNGVMQIVKEDKPPFRFENGVLKATEEEAKEIRKKRLFGTLYEELPTAVEKVAGAKTSDSENSEDSEEEVETTGADTKSASAKPKEPAKPEIKTTVVDSVKSFNDASNYLKENFGLEHKDVNTKDKVFDHASRLSLEFPNYPEDPEEEKKDTPEE